MSSITELLDELQIKILDMEDKLEDLDRATRRLRQERDEATSELRRSISADDLREGMQVAYCVPRGKWETCTVQRSADGTGEGFKDPTWGRRVFGIEDTIVLLEDAPGPEQPTTTVADLESAPGSTWEDRSGDTWDRAEREESLRNYLRDSDAASDPTDDDRALTVADLEAAPVGSKLSEVRVARIARIKANDGTWPRVSEGGRPYTKSGINPGQIWGLEDRTLTYPEPEPVSAEAIRTSEPGSTWDWHCPGRGVSTWEWDGEIVSLHARDGSLVPGGTPDNLFVHTFRVTRSSALSRGDYSPRAPKVGDEVTTEEELEALPALSVVLDKDGYAFRKSRGPGEWFTAGDSEPWDFEEMIPPFKVVHVGGEGA